MMLAGRLNQRITLQRRVVTRDVYGGETITWADLATVWAEARSLTGREYLSQRTEASETLVRMQMRWIQAVTPKDRAVWRGVAHDIEAVLDTTGQQVEMILMCKVVTP